MGVSLSVELAQGYLDAGLCVLPAIRAEKRPAVGSWKTWAERLPNEYEVRAWFANHPDAVCVVAGRVSGNLECVDFDNHGELFDAWRSRIDPELFGRLVVERTPSGGYHVLYRSAGEISGNLKLARGERSAKVVTLIETRGNGGLFLCAPTPGYTLLQGEFAHIPTLSPEEREGLLAAARGLDEIREAPKSAPCGPAAGGTDNQPTPAAGAHVGADFGDCGDFALRPGDDYCQRGDIRSVLEAHGWELVGSKPDGNELWRRPGKASGTHSATFDGSVFYVFSSNAAPFESERGYSRFQVYATLECGGDYTRAARELLGRGYGQAQAIDDVDFSRLNTSPRSAADTGTGGAEGTRQARPPLCVPLGELVSSYPKMRPVLIHGFLRIGETMNIIAPPKTGKSWLVTDLALSVATGSPWFGFPCEKGKVLIMDNELHPETSANRIPKVVEARGVDLREVRDRIYVDNQRGRLGSIEDIASRIEELKPYGFRLIIIDAFYRAMPRGTDENDNGTVAGIYNLIDKYAAALNCAFVLIHHTSKGNQSLKSVTDVGAGAGSQSRAADTHVILRRHREENAVVMESVVRSFPSVGPVCLRWNWPLWNRDDTLNPEDLEGKAEARPPRRGTEQAAEEENILQRMRTLADPGNPLPKTEFVRRVQIAYDISRTRARDLFEEACDLGYLKCDRIEARENSQRSTKFVLPGERSPASGEEEDED